MIVLALVTGAAIGVVLGALGGGGAVLTVPAMVYLLGLPVPEATAASLFVVGAAALVGAGSHARNRTVRWQLGLVVAGASLPAAWLGARLAEGLDDTVVMGGFAAVLGAAAVAMVSGSLESTRAGRPTAADRGDGPSCCPGRLALVLATGVGVGVLTGVFGVGGGFLVVPALVLLVRLPMPAAVGTSLLVIGASSAAALAARVLSPAGLSVPWPVVLPFLAAAVAGAWAGRAVAAGRSPRALRRAFALLLVGVAAATAAAALG